MHQHSRLIMLIDDDQVDHFVNGKIIQHTGFASDIIVKDNVPDALNYLQAHQDNESLLPEIIFLDLHMPIHDGFNFLEVFEHLPPVVQSKCRLIILSSTSDPQVIKRLRQHAPSIPFIAKPISEEALRQIHGAYTRPLTKL